MEQIFNQIPEDTFKSLVTQAGVIMLDFDPEKDKLDRETVQSKLAFATTGGIQIRTTAEFVDNGEEIDNCPNNMMELKDIEGGSWDCGFSTTAISASPNVIALGIGVADISTVTRTSNDEKQLTKIVPRDNVQLKDFRTLTWGCHTANGGILMAVFYNAMSTDGFNLQTQKNNKGQFALNVTAHYSIKKQDVVPVAYYHMDGDNNSEGLAINSHSADSFVRTSSNNALNINKDTED